MSRKVILSMQMTLDGYVVGPNDNMDWIIGGDDVWNEMFKDLESVDTFLLGHAMYSGYASYWRSMLEPSSDPNLHKFAKIADQTHHIVFTTRKFTPDWKNTTVAKNPSEEIARLKNQTGKDIMAWGGATFAADLINLGLIDEYRISLNPTLLGAGKRLTNDLAKITTLKLLSAQPLQSGLIVLKYTEKL